jgi:two-component system, LuxR family, sensor kinase FixL
MEDNKKTKEQLIKELKKVRLQAIKLEKRLCPENKRLEEKLKRQEELQIMLDSVPAWIFYKDKENRFIRVNKVFADIMDMPKEQLEGKSLFELYSEDRAESYWRDDKEVISSGKPKLNIIEPVETRKGRLWVKTDKMPYRDSHGNIIGIIGFAIDITEKIRAENVLRERGEKYRKIVMESMGDGYFEVDLEGNILFANKSFARILGYSRKELMGMNYRHYMDRESANRASGTFEKVFKTGSPSKSEEWNIIAKDETKMIVEASLSLLRKTDGEPIGYRGIMRDVTKRKRSKEALQESEEKYRTLFEESMDAVFITTAEGEILDVNQSFCDLFGYRQDEVRDLKAWAFYPSRKARERSLREIGKIGFLKEHEIKLRKKDGTLFDGLANLTLRYSRDGKHIGYHGLVRDITEQKNMQKQILEASDSERRKIGHELHDELGQLLTGIAFKSKSLEQYLKSRSLPEVKDAERLTLLVNQTINQIRRISKGLVPMDLEMGGLQTALKEMSANAIQTCGASCRLYINCRTDNLKHTIATQLYYIAQEAITNVIKHSRAKNIEISLTRDKEGIVLSVKDDGIGVIDRARLKDGIGMQIMKYRARLIDATLDIYQNPDSGTIVICKLLKQAGR